MITKITRDWLESEGAYRTIDSLQMAGDYAGIREIIQYATAALVNDGEDVTLDSEAQRLRKIIREFCEGQKWADKLWQSQSHIKPLFDEVQDAVQHPGVRCRHCGEEIYRENGEFWVHRNSLTMFCPLSAEPVEDRT